MFYELYCNYNIPILMVYSCGSINHVVVFTKLYIYDDTYGKVNKLPINEFIQMYHIENIVCMYMYIKNTAVEDTTGKTNTHCSSESWQ